ncbi:MAG: UvrD-helicase domain-containing protein, partial [Leucobacter sp.]
MTRFDRSQQRVLDLDPGRHARVLGAPGSGKTLLLVEAYARSTALPGWSEADVLALVPSRLAAASVRAAIEARVQRALGGSPARTPAALAFAVLGQTAAVSGEPAPRLLTGTVQDEAVAAAIEQRIERGSGASASDGPAVLAPEILRSPAFRAELREFWRVLDDFDLDPAHLLEQLAALRGRAASEAMTDAPDDARIERWSEALRVIVEVEARLRDERPGELSSSALLRSAARELRSGSATAPRLLLVDDAQELGEGGLALIAACAAAGSSVWAFGDADTATETFHGERTRVMSDLAGELSRRGVRADAEQTAVLDVVHRHGAGLREFVRDLTTRIGAAGAGPQREARADEGAGAGAVDFAVAASPSEQLGIIAHRMRSRRLGLGGDGAEHDGDVRGNARLDWGAMAVICRSRAEAARIARGLAGHQVPTGVAAGGIVLREHRIVRDLIRLLQHARGIAPLDAQGVLQLLGGPVGGLDPVAVRRLRGALMLQERREVREENREARSTDDLVLAAFADPMPDPAVDSRGGRALRKLGRIAAAGSQDAAAGGTPRENLWALWAATGLAEDWQGEALQGRGHRSDEAHRSLDAVLGLFFALQRHEEQASAQPIEELLEELLESAVPEDSLARRAERDAVTVTTPQGAVGREFDLVAVVGAQDGAWPNTRARGSLLGTVALERWLRGGEAGDPSRRDTIHDELRLFAQACSRARGELLVVAIGDDENHPSPFFGFGREHLREGLPSSRLTLRGATAELRRRLVADPADATALAGLAALARAEVPGAHPDEWYG